MIVVDDTSAITTLLQIGKASLLQDLYHEVLIPEAVRVELLILHSSLPDFIETFPVKDRNAVARLLRVVDGGEAEAIVLAKKKHADLLLIDESEGRAVARREGINFVGLLGVLVQAKFRGFIPSVHEVLGEIENSTTFFVSQEIKNVALRTAGEL